MIEKAAFHYRGMSIVFCLIASVVLCSCADLVVKQVNYEQFTGPNLVMKTTIKNEGSKQAPASTAKLDIRYSLSAPYVERSRMATPPLDPGRDVELPIWVFPPTSLAEPGSCMYAKVCADTDNTVTEGWLGENNNCLVRAFMNRRYCGLCTHCCDETLPSVFDWRNENGTYWITGVRDQQACGSCWAHSAIATVEAKYNIERNTVQNPANLSEQHLVSCPGGGGSCLGGWPGSAMNYMQNNGVVEETTLPFTSGNCTTSSGNALLCTASCSSATLPGCANPLLTAAQCDALDDPTAPGGANPALWLIGGHGGVPGGTVEAVKRGLLCHGPLSVCGTWYIDSDGNGHGHCVLLVGWNDSAVSSLIASALGWSTGGWVIKNSWGTGWSSSGYGIIPFSGHTFSNLINSARYVQDVTRRP